MKKKKSDVYKLVENVKGFPGMIKWCIDMGKIDYEVLEEDK